VIFGLYQKTINAVSSVFKEFKKSIIFLVPLIAGFGVGILIFSKIVDFLLLNFEMQTRFAFLGLVLGTIPLFYKEVKKEGFSKKYYLLIAVFAILGLLLFTFNSTFPQIKDPNLFQSASLGVAVAGSSIIPGVDSAVILSSLGLYELYVSSLANLDFNVLIPAGVGLAAGALIISFIMNFFIKRFYTITFSVIFGLFISIIPNVLSKKCILSFNWSSVISIVFMVIGFIISFYLGDIKRNNQRIKKIFNLLSKK
jgi:putative membrane protein